MGCMVPPATMIDLHLLTNSLNCDAGLSKITFIDFFFLSIKTLNSLLGLTNACKKATMYNIGQDVFDVASDLASIFLSVSGGLSCFKLAKNAETPVFFSFWSVLDALKKKSKINHSPNMYVGHFFSSTYRLL